MASISASLFLALSSFCLVVSAISAFFSFSSRTAFFTTPNWERNFAYSTANLLYLLLGPLGGELLDEEKESMTEDLALALSKEKLVLYLWIKIQGKFLSVIIIDIGFGLDYILIASADDVHNKNNLTQKQHVKSLKTLKIL